VTIIGERASAVGRLCGTRPHERSRATRPDQPLGELDTAGLAEHTNTVAKILAAAHERDAISDARDAAAEERERELTSPRCWTPT
jgi:hypothetical protein